MRYSPYREIIRNKQLKLARLFMVVAIAAGCLASYSYSLGNMEFFAFNSILLAINAAGCLYNYRKAGEI